MRFIRLAFILCFDVAAVKIPDVLGPLLSQQGIELMPGNPWEDGPLKIGLGFKIRKILDLDISNGVLDFTIWVRQRWLDERLLFDGPASLGPGWNSQVDSLPMPRDSVWKPDIYLANAATGGEAESTSEKGVYLFDKTMAATEGWNVYWIEPVTLRSKCDIDLSMFPFDEQNCFLSFESWMYNDRMINITLLDMAPRDDEHLYTQSYDLNRADLSVSAQTYALTGRSYRSATLSLTFKRYPQYYIINAIIPMMIMELMSLLTVWIPVEGGERLSYGITGLLTIMAIALFLAEKRPAAAVETWLDRFQSECYLVSFLPVFYSTLILWWTNERANLIEAKAALGEWERKEGGSDGEVHGQNSLKRGLSKLVTQDYITPVYVDMFVRHTTPILLAAMLTHQLGGMPTDTDVSSSGSGAIIQLPCWMSIVVLNAVTLVVIIRLYLKGTLTNKQLDRLTGIRVRFAFSPSLNLPKEVMASLPGSPAADLKSISVADRGHSARSVNSDGTSYSVTHMVSQELPSVGAEAEAKAVPDSSPSSVRSAPASMMDRVERV
mmetsp:Transcript_1201/g.2436  ORF Transcript_1201/g.2436 Transcript_1201/m.2436 type:complete len:550 (-) Transcript_1201:140-1789(-)